jgi:hypothetical protein
MALSIGSLFEWTFSASAFSRGCHSTTLPPALGLIKLWLFVISSGFCQDLYGSGEQVDDADEGLDISVSSRPCLGSLEDPVKGLDAAVVVFG